VVQYSKLLQPFLSRHTTNLLLCWGRVLRHETKHSTEVTRFSRYFINNNKKKKKKEKKKEKEKEKEKKNLMKIHVIINNNINIDNDNNNSNEDLDSLPTTGATIPILK